MEMDFKKYYKYITSEAIEQIEEKMRGLNAQEDMAYIVYFTDSVREEAEKLCC